MTVTVKIFVIIQSWPLNYWSGGGEGSKSTPTCYTQHEGQHFHIISTPVRYTKHASMTTHAQTSAITLASTRLHAPLPFTHKKRAIPTEA